jgi:hypothetical protein
METSYENSLTHVKSSHLCFRSIAGGVLVAMLTMATLIGLGMAMGGIGLDEDTTAQSAGMFTGIWFMVSAALSLFAGSFYSARVSTVRDDRMGAAQGILIAALFLGFFLYQTIAAIGFAGQAVGVVGKGAMSAAKSPMVTEGVGRVVERGLGDLNLKTEPRAVATGLAHRLMDGDVEGAKNFLADQAGITPAEADAKIAQFKAESQKIIDDAKLAAASALRSTGWSLFIVMLLGSVASVLGGFLGSRTHQPMVVERRTFAQRTA